MKLKKRKYLLLLPLLCIICSLFYVYKMENALSINGINIYGDSIEINCRAIRNFSSELKKIKQFSKLKHLTVLNIDNTDLTGIEIFPNLESLTISNSNLYNVNMDILKKIDVNEIDFINCENLDSSKLEFSNSVRKLSLIHEGDTYGISILPFEKFKNINTLVITTNYFSEPSEINKLNQISSLTLIKTKSNNPFDVQNISQLDLKELYFDEVELSNTILLNKFLNLEKLYSNMSIFNYEDLCELVNMRELIIEPRYTYKMYDNKELDIWLKCIQNMPKLEVLKCGNNVIDLIWLKNCHNLRELGVSAKSINIDTFSDFHMLDSLIINANEILISKKMFQIKKFTCYNLYCNNYDFCNLLECIPNVEDFSINPYQGDTWHRINDISRMETLQNCKHLKRLQLNGTGTGTGDIKFLSSCLELKYLELTNLNIYDVEPLHEMLELEELRLDFNKINDISSLEKLINLKKFSIIGNNISNINSICFMKNLELLNLMNNNIRDLSSVSGLNKLKYINIEGNFINNLECLSNMNNLVYLYTSSVDSLDTSWAYDLKSLKELYLYKSNIIDFDFLNELPSLEFVIITYTHDVVDTETMDNLRRKYCGLDTEYEIFIQYESNASIE